MEKKDDSHVQYHTVLVRRAGQDTKEPTPAEYADDRLIQVTNCKNDEHKCRGRSVNKVVLLGIKVADLHVDMHRTLHNAQLTRQSYTGIAPSFIELEPTL